MRIAVIIPIYNQACYLNRCLDSLKNQSDGDFTAYCVNDGSTDGSQKIIDDFVGLDRRFVSIRKSNGGLSSARNAGLDAAVRDGVDACLFLDSDDFLHPQCIEFVRKAAYAHPGCVIEYRFTSRPTPEEFLSRRYACSPEAVVPCRPSGTVWNKLYPREAIRGLRFAEEVRYSEDIVFTTELELKVRPQYRLLPFDLHYYTENPNSMSRVAFDAENFCRRVVTIECLVRTFEGDPEGLGRLIRGPLPSLLKRYYRDLMRRVRADEFPEARRVFARELASLWNRGLLRRDRSCLKDVKYYLLFLFMGFVYGRDDAK